MPREYSNVASKYRLRKSTMIAFWNFTKHTGFIVFNSKIIAWMEQLFLPEQFGPGHLNVIRLGREICHPRNPECERCPLKVLCDYYQELKTQAEN